MPDTPDNPDEPDETDASARHAEGDAAPASDSGSESGESSLSQRTARGFFWMLLQTAGTQFVTFFGQIALAWLLIPEDFGLYALATAIGVGAAAAHKVGLRPILVNRYRAFRLWANPAFWFSLTLGLGSSVLLLIASPFADAVFDTDGLRGLIQVLAITMPFTAISVIPEAKIQAEMRFRLLAIVRFWMAAGTMGFTVLLALLDFGVYSFVMARVIVAMSRAAGLYWSTSVPLRWTPQFRRWRYLVRDGAHMLVSNVANYVTANFDKFILGFFHSEAIVGVYFYAFGLSQRAFVMLTGNLRDVLFPSLNSLQSNPRRQMTAYLRATRLLIVIGMPVCLLQAALAGPAFGAVLPDRMSGAAPVLQILSFGTAFRLAGQPAFALIQAQGRFGLMSRISVTVAALFLVTILIGARVGAEQSVAIAASAFMAVTGPCQIWLAIRRDGGTIGDVVGIFFRPAVLGLIAVGGAWWIAGTVPAVINRDWQMLLTIPILSGAFYLPLVRIGMPSDWADLIYRIGDIVRRRRGGSKCSEMGSVR